jgi:hypothetical protein
VKRTARVVLVIVILAPCVGYTSTSLKGERVRATKHESDVADCRLLGEVESFPPWVGPKDAQHTLQNKAAELGGDVVLLSYGIGKATGKAYDCGGRFRRPS